MLLYPPGIDADFDEQEQLSDDDNISSVPSVSIVKRKKQEKGKGTESAAFSRDFTEGFQFDADADEDRVNFDNLDGLRLFLKRNSLNQTSLVENIQKERRRIGLGKEPLQAETNEFGNGGRTEQGDDDLLQEMSDKTDRIKLKQSKKKAASAVANGAFFDSQSKQITQQLANRVELTFDDLNLSRPILKAVSEAGFIHPTPIQKTCIPVALTGRDICACSATGTGKTAAFILPILERLLFRPHSQKSVTRVLVLVPTRELAIQVFQVSRQLAKYSNVEMCLAAGGLDVKAQEAALRLGLDIVIATPGRLIDHLHNSPNFSLSDIEVLVLDEADRMLDEQFTEQMKEIIRLCARNRQTLLFSATMTEEVEALASLSLNKPVKLFINENTDTALNLHQEFVRIRREDRNNEREAIIAALVTRNFPDHCIVFMRTKHHCERMHVLLGLLGVKAGKLHGGMTQVQRVEALYAFKRQQKVQVLCATDLAARGLDIEGVMTVINMHMPNTAKHYVHRVGRTARAGKTGRSISLTGEEDRKLLKEIAKMNRTGGPPIMQRSIEPDVIEAYLRRIGDLEPSVDKLIGEEEAEKQLLLAEKSIKKAEEQIKSIGKGTAGVSSDNRQRNWMTKNAKKMGSDRNSWKKERIRSKGRRREAKKKLKCDDAEEKMPTIAPTEGGQKRGGKRSAFTAEITDVDHSSLKQFRHGPDDLEFKKAKREKQKNGEIRKGLRKK